MGTIFDNAYPEFDIVNRLSKPCETIGEQWRPKQAQIEGELDIRLPFRIYWRDLSHYLMDRSM